MRILLMNQAVMPHDAIGNDIAYMTGLFGEWEYCREKQGEVVVYCETRREKECRYNYVERSEALEILKNPENLVIYHHSIYWEDGEKLLKEAQVESSLTEKKKTVVPARLIIRYHNVTPPDFFADYSPIFFQSCTKGREQTEQLQEAFPEAWWLCDSAYNAAELTKVPESRKKKIHPFHNLTAWEDIHPDRQVLDKLQEEKAVKVLFTGRVVPNKGHLSLVAMLEDFRENYGDHMVLYIIGKFDENLKLYTEEVKFQILAAGLEERIRFVGEITDEVLLAYYQGCDYYVSFSDHEGFGVPIIEAQYLGLPVIAKNAAAVGEVLGDGGLSFENEISHYSAAIAYLEERPQVRQELIQAGRDNCFNRYNNEKAGKELLEWLEAEVVKA